TGERLTPYHHDGKLCHVAPAPQATPAHRTQQSWQPWPPPVLSVDGINVPPANTSAATLQSGYVIAAGQSCGVTGWPKVSDDVAQFIFTALARLLYARRGRAANRHNRVAVYRENTPATGRH
ncbi:MAG: hypothetical protein IPO38_02820, partial [Rhodocyclaceae bacterium]|nr:hypothetical protein [Rhodocyclaceae bacterium]